MTLALKISNFTKYYGEMKAVSNLNLEVNEGDFFGFLGPNGAGKTTTISAICGINQFTEGTIEVFGSDVKKEYRKARMQIGLSPQDYNVDHFLTVKDILWFVGGFYQIPKKVRLKRIADLLETLNLQEHAEKQFLHLSGGMKRRAVLAKALIHDPKLLILDEPTAALDIEVRHELLGYLKKINKMGKTIILTSHYLEEVELLCNKIAMIKKGHLVFLKDKEEALKDGQNLEKIYIDIIHEKSEF